MRKKHLGYGVSGTYEKYGLTRERAAALLKECKAGKYTELLQAAAQQTNPYIAKWIISSIAEGKSLHDMEVKWELGQAEIMPCCRNSFYSYRKLTLVVLDRMLSGKDTVIHGRL